MLLGNRSDAESWLQNEAIMIVELAKRKGYPLAAIRVKMLSRPSGVGESIVHAALESAFA
jgi:hypothetical protein